MMKQFAHHQKWILSHCFGFITMLDLLLSVRREEKQMIVGKTFFTITAKISSEIRESLHSIKSLKEQDNTKPKYVDVQINNI